MANSLTSDGLTLGSSGHTLTNLKLKGVNELVLTRSWVTPDAMTTSSRTYTLPSMSVNAVKVYNIKFNDYSQVLLPSGGRYSAYVVPYNSPMFGTCEARVSSSLWCIKIAYSYYDDNNELKVNESLLNTGYSTYSGSAQLIYMNSGERTLFVIYRID